MPKPRSTAKGYEHARQLRRSLTPAERRLWSRLRGDRLGDVSFRRQHAIGNYIVDFCSPGKKLVLELDGSQHLEQTEYDAERTAFLESQGYRVLRIWNSQVKSDIQGAIRKILGALQATE